MIGILGAAEFESIIPRLAEILIDAVDSGAGGFLYETSFT